MFELHSDVCQNLFEILHATRYRFRFELIRIVILPSRTRTTRVPMMEPIHKLLVIITRVRNTFRPVIYFVLTEHRAVLRNSPTL